MKSLSGAELGAALGGIAAFITAVGGLVAVFYYNTPTDAAQQDEAPALAQRPGGGRGPNTSTPSTGISQLEVEVAETTMKKVRKVADARKCHESQVETW